MLSYQGTGGKLGMVQEMLGHEELRFRTDISPIGYSVDSALRAVEMASTCMKLSHPKSFADDLLAGFKDKMELVRAFRGIELETFSKLRHDKALKARSGDGGTGEVSGIP